MKNLPSFNEFRKYDSLMESVGPELINEFKTLEQADPYHTVNEGQFLNDVKNTLSKFFLGAFSRVGMIDEARKVLVNLEIDLIEAKHKFENEMDDMDAQVRKLTGPDDKERVIALRRDMDAKIKEYQTYVKTQKLKIKKSEEFVEKVIDGSERRREYYEVGRSEDEIALAELEYKLAKDKADSSELKKYEDKIAQAREDAKEKAEKIENKLEDEAKEEGENKKLDTSVDPEKEKKKISSRRGKDIIHRKNSLAKEIADLKSELERKLKSLQSKSEKGKITEKAIKSYMIELLDLSSALDAKNNLLKILNDLGQSESDISSKVRKESEFTQLTNKINQSITDGQDANTGTKKVVSGIFSSVAKGAKGEINPEKIKDAIKKINE
jgi:chromosome segregation ATPase